MKHFFTLSLLFLLVSHSLTAQEDTSFIQKDIKDVISKTQKKAEEPGSSSLLLVPVISSSPVTGLMLGVAGQLAWYNGDVATTRISQASANLNFTSKDQQLLIVKSTIYGKDDDFLLMGDWRAENFSESTYGLGTNAPGDSLTIKDKINLSGISSGFGAGEQPLKFRLFRFKEAFYDRIDAIDKYFYAGIGYNLEIYDHIKDLRLDTDTPGTTLTSHYAYSKKYGFNPTHYTVSGVSLNVLYDSRDNQIYPYKGFYANLQYQINPDFLGSSRNSTSTWLEIRAYKILSKEVPRHQLALWAFASVQASGTLPYLSLPASTYDMRNRSSRGYIQGRFRGQDLLYSEAEYRFPISQRTGVLGGVVFVNAVTTSNRDLSIKLFDYVKPAAGVGLRLMFDKASRTNLALDFAYGQNSACFYLGAGEVF